MLFRSVHLFLISSLSLNISLIDALFINQKNSMYHIYVCAHVRNRILLIPTRGKAFGSTSTYGSRVDHGSCNASQDTDTQTQTPHRRHCYSTWWKLLRTHMFAHQRSRSCPWSSNTWYYSWEPCFDVFHNAGGRFRCTFH